MNETKPTLLGLLNGTNKHEMLRTEHFGTCSYPAQTKQTKLVLDDESRKLCLRVIRRSKNKLLKNIKTVPKHAGEDQAKRILRLLDYNYNPFEDKLPQACCIPTGEEWLKTGSAFANSADADYYCIDVADVDMRPYNEEAPEMVNEQSGVEIRRTRVELGGGRHEFRNLEVTL